ncbi:hypothetical protein KL942_003647 [Ogataea angusta]|uniref:Uncharacterized protein n=1 Tax=Pichia angusta TaxID=870730 RepID=A0ABQ7RWW9_PICAN|nr:hypothetical protein KL942_003647 [Ogataea angusta]KAG7849604.1 hypothetical protein KL940_002634 [Ogataea angusta]
MQSDARQQTHPGQWPASRQIQNCSTKMALNLPTCHASRAERRRTQASEYSSTDTPPVLHEGLRQAARAHWSRRPPSRLGAVPFQAGPFSQHYIIQIFMQQHGKLDNVYVCFEPLALCENVQLRRDPDPEPRHRA